MFAENLEQPLLASTAMISATFGVGQKGQLFIIAIFSPLVFSIEIQGVCKENMGHRDISFTHLELKSSHLGDNFFMHVFVMATIAKFTNC